MHCLHQFNGKNCKRFQLVHNLHQLPPKAKPYQVEL